MKRQIIYIYLIAIAMIGCEPYIEDDISLPSLPSAPSITIEPTVDNPNRVVIKADTDGFFSYVWDLPGGTPKNSTLAIDTVLYTKAGDYTITLHAASEDGGGTASASQTVNFTEDAVADCSDELVLLTGGCDNPNGKCWTFSRQAGAITVGPIPGSGEWFTSNESSLQESQYDDYFCFTFENTAFQYNNNGSTIDPFNGYVDIEYAPPTDHTYTLIPGGGENGETRIVLTEGSFMGVWDSGPLYDIVELTETTLVVRSQIVNSDGWFELYFQSL